MQTKSEYCKVEGHWYKTENKFQIEEPYTGQNLIGTYHFWTLQCHRNTYNFVLIMGEDLKIAAGDPSKGTITAFA